MADRPEFIQHRLAIFDKIKAKRDEEIAGMPPCRARAKPDRGPT